MNFKKIFNIIVYIFAFIGFFLTAGYFAVRFGLTNTSGIIDRQSETYQSGNSSAGEGSDTEPYISKLDKNFWSQNNEWLTLQEAIKKDRDLIYRASETSNVEPRIIVTQLVVEQLRLFNSERESFKKFFEPLKILGSQTKFSWGVMGIKEETAIQIERNLKDVTSLFYLGKEFENLLDFQNTEASKIKEERFVRMTDQHAHYYSYLYAGLYLKQVMTQWQRAGYDISNRPEILTTLYNIGFANSKPNPDPKSGGAEIDIGNYKFSFGSLGKEFYYSDQLIDIFPR